MAKTATKAFIKGTKYMCRIFLLEDIEQKSSEAINCMGGELVLCCAPVLRQGEIAAENINGGID